MIVFETLMVIALEQWSHSDCCLLGPVIADDNSTMRAQMKWSDADWMVDRDTDVPSKATNPETLKKTIRPDKGRLMCPHPKPLFLDIPVHRTKTVGGKVHGLMSKKLLAISKGINKVDAMKTKKKCGDFLNQITELSQAQWVSAAQAALEHHFENHKHCGEWCQRRRMTALELETD